MKNIAVIGAGKFGKNFIRTINEMEDVQLSHVVSKNPETKDLVLAGTRILPSFEELLKERIDGVIIVTPPGVRFPIAKAFLENGVPVLSEKPITLDLEESNELVRLSEENKTLLMVDYIHLHSEAFKTLKSKLQNYTVSHIASMGGNNGPVRDDCNGLYDYGPHDLAMILEVAGTAPTDIKITSSEQRSKHQMNIAAQLTFPHMTAEVTFGNYFDDKTRFFRVETETGTFIYDSLMQKQLVFQREAIELENRSPMENIVRTFANSSFSDNQNWLIREVQRLLHEFYKVFNN